jgi:hypothetical protein
VTQVVRGEFGFAVVGDVQPGELGGEVQHPLVPVGAPNRAARGGGEHQQIGALAFHVGAQFVDAWILEQKLASA